MFMDRDIRWEQRFENFRKSLSNLERACTQESYNELELQGLVKAFELSYELAWKTLQDLFKERGYENILGPKPVIRQAFSDGLIADGELWSALHEARNLASHVYDQERAALLSDDVKRRFLPALQGLSRNLDSVRSK